MDKFTFEIPAPTTWRFAGQLPHLLSLLGFKADDEVDFLKIVERYMHTSSKVPPNIDQWSHTTVPLLATEFVDRFGAEMWGNEAFRQPKYEE